MSTFIKKIIFFLIKLKFFIQFIQKIDATLFLGQIFLIWSLHLLELVDFFLYLTWRELIEVFVIPSHIIKLLTILFYHVYGKSTK
jgi:hypothetical protein